MVARTLCLLAIIDVHYATYFDCTTTSCSGALSCAPNEDCAIACGPTGSCVSVAITCPSSSDLTVICHSRESCLGATWYYYYQDSQTFFQCPDNRQQCDNKRMMDIETCDAAGLCTAQIYDIYTIPSYASYWDGTTFEPTPQPTSMATPNPSANPSQESTFEPTMFNLTNINMSTSTTFTPTNITVTCSNTQFPASMLTATSRYDMNENYVDPNDMDTCIFSADEVGLDTKLSDNFVVSEFQCHDGSDGLRLSPVLIECLQDVRDDVNEAIVVLSGYRTITYNAALQRSAANSYHLSGTAADIKFGAESSKEILDLASSIICNCRPLFQSHGYDIEIGIDAASIHIAMEKGYSAYTYDGFAELTDSEWKEYVANKDCSVTTTTTSSTTSNNHTTAIRTSILQPSVAGCQVHLVCHAVSALVALYMCC